MLHIYSTHQSHSARVEEPLGPEDGQVGDIGQHIDNSHQEDTQHVGAGEISE